MVSHLGETELRRAKDGRKQRAEKKKKGRTAKSTKVVKIDNVRDTAQGFVSVCTHHFQKKRGKGLQKLPCRREKYLLHNSGGKN